MSSPKKYLNYEEIKLIIGDLQPDDTFKPMSQDSYNETLIAQEILKTNMKDALMEAAINISIIGVGNQKYGNFQKADKIVDIANLLQSTGVKTKLSQNTVLKDNDLTVGRLCRFFRFHTRNYLLKTRHPTYLWRKYSDQDPQYNNIMFRGAEYLENLADDEKNALRAMYTRMDNRLGTRFVERFDRIRQAQSGEIILVNT